MAIIIAHSTKVSTFLLLIVFSFKIKFERISREANPIASGGSFKSGQKRKHALNMPQSA
jgi:hypothetical protein